MKISENVKISSLTTMRIGGPARFVIDVEDPDEVRGAYTFAREKNLPVYVLGSGANTLGRDEGFDGVIVRNRILGIEKVASREGLDIRLASDRTPNASTNAFATNAAANIAAPNTSATNAFSADPSDPNLSEGSELFDALETLKDGETLWFAAGGETWNDFVLRTAEEGFTGVESLAAIPGTVGAAPVQNIGAYGHDASESIFAVVVFDSLASEYRVLFPDELDFSYRHSIFNSSQFGRYFIISVYFRLHKGTIKDPLPDGSPAPELYNSLQAYLDSNAISDFSPASIAAAVTAVRADKLPDPSEIASAGSFFKNVYLSDSEAKSAEEKGIPVRRSLISGSENSQDAVYENKVNTGWLVEHCGLMGKNLHGFHINEKAALVLVNDSSESYGDLAAARDEIRSAVREKFGLEIEQEPVELEPPRRETKSESSNCRETKSESSNRRETKTESSRRKTKSEPPRRNEGNLS